MNEKRLSLFVGKDWANVLIPFFKSEDWTEIQNQLKSDKLSGEIFCPRERDLFRCFKECPFDTLHSVIFVDECYNKRIPNSDKFYADGIALSSKYSYNCPNALNHIITSLEIEECNNLSKDVDDYDLKPWANQGILLLNCSLTAILNQDYEHANLWKPFIVYICNLLNVRKDRLGIIFMGKYANTFRSIFDNPSFGLFGCDHPSDVKGTGRIWNDESAFSNLMKFQKEMNNIDINWE